MLSLAALVLVAQAIEIPEVFRSLGVAGGLLAFLFITEVVVAGAVAKKWERRYDAVRDKLEAKDAYLVQEIVPLLVRAVDVLPQILEVLRRAQNSQGRDGG